MKRRGNLLIISLLIILLLLPPASAFSFSDFWNNLFNKGITGGITDVTCVDTDGGFYPMTYGEVTTNYAASYGSGDNGVYRDKCYETTWDGLPLSYVVEYTCNGEGGTLSSGAYHCTRFNLACVDGACVAYSVPQGLTCSDSDGGKTYGTKGTATSSDGTSKTDSCSAGYLLEAYCDSNNQATRESYSCSNANGMNCQDGVCSTVSSTTPTPTSTTSSTSITCSDSDGGKDYTKYGTATLSNGTALADSCSSETSLFETSCSVSPGQISITSYTCHGSNGTRCIGGACISSDTTTSTTPPSSTTSTSATPATPATSVTPSTSTSTAVPATSDTPAVPASLSTPTTPSIPAIPVATSTQQENITNLVCKDSDDGKIDYILGKTCQNDNCVQDLCLSNEYLLEGFCSEDYSSISILECPYGCKNGVCLQENTIVFNPDSYSGPIKVPEELIDEEISEVEFVCNGCFSGNKCYPFGYRKSKQYCSEDSSFVDQFGEKESCENNFQCKSNVCVSEECISASLIKKVLEFFASMFS